MNKVILGIFILLVLFVLGCAVKSEPISQPTFSSPSELTQSVLEQVPRVETPTNEPPIDKTWISPGKVMIGNFHTGGRAEWNIKVHNGKDTNVVFAVNYRTPDYAEEGYLRPPADIVQSWVIITDNNPVLLPKETKNIAVAIAMPNEVTNLQSEFWEFQRKGSDYLLMQRQQISQQVTSSMIKQYGEQNFTQLVKDVKSETVAIAELEGKLKRSVSKEVNEKLMLNPETNLLVFLQDKNSVSRQVFNVVRPNSDIVLINKFITQGFVRFGDLKRNNWEFWISIFDNTQKGMVVTELCSRWLVSMRQ